MYNIINMSKININGSIGYTVLIKDNIKILVLADMHSELPYCEKDGIFISDWLKNKFKSKILLEEVPRVGPKLKELWPSSPHTQKLKEEYLKNSHIIQGVDIRPFLIPFSWELAFDKDTPVINLKQYLTLINIFFNLKLDLLRKDLKDVYTKEFLKKTKLGEHYLELKRKVKNYIKRNKKFLQTNIKDLLKENEYLLEQINDLISDIMEWYMISKIFQGLSENKTSFIIHAGLAHTTNLINLLKIKYGYKILEEFGNTDLNNITIENTGCLQLPIDIEKQFGGTFSYGFFS
jgi:hypothetical protein